MIRRFFVFSMGNLPFYVGGVDVYFMASGREAVNHMEWKRVRVSKQRQVTIPRKFFDRLGIKDEVEIGLQGRSLVIRPVREEAGKDHFAELILADLVQEGCPSEEWVAKFRERQAELRQAAKDLVAEAREAARKLKGTGDNQIAELFGDVMRGEMGPPNIRKVR